NAGNNALAAGTADLDRQARIVAGTVDMGAYEYQTPRSVLSYAWLQQYGLPTDGSADYADSDTDGMNNWQEWRAGTDPRKSSSVLRLLSPVLTNQPPGLTISWESVGGITYYLQRSTALGGRPSF